MKDYTRHPLLTRHKATEDTPRRSGKMLAAVIVLAAFIAATGLQLAWFFHDSGQPPRQLASVPPTQPASGESRIEVQPPAETRAVDESTNQPGDPGSSLIGNQIYPNESGQTKTKVSNSAATSRLPGDLKATLEALRLEGVTVEQISEDSRRFTIVGFAEDNVRIAAYMRLLDAEVGKPELNYVQLGQRQEQSVSEFSIAMQK